MNRTINTPEVFVTGHLGFSQAVAGNGKTRIYLSGQVGWDVNRQLTGKKDFGSQMRQALENIKIILKSENANLESVVRMEIYVVTLRRERSVVITEILNEYYPDAYKPSTTLIGVAALALDELEIEVQAIAEI